MHDLAPSRMLGHLRDQAKTFPEDLAFQETVRIIRGALSCISHGAATVCRARQPATMPPGSSGDGTRNALVRQAYPHGT